MVLGGGAAFAATKLGKNSVGTKQIKKGAVTAAKIKSGTITGTQINLAKLGTVPSATTATTAGTANALSPPEALHLVGGSGQPGFLDGSSNGFIKGVSVQLAPVGFFKDHDGVVHLQGTPEVGKGENPISGLIFQLPAGDRPASGTLQIFPTIGEEGNEIVVIGSNVTLEGTNLEGDVFTNEKSEELTSLAGITFRAES
ncbi:MAG: hypothetical protein WB507_10640 [Solirubrobacterales bacterium]